MPPDRTWLVTRRDETGKGGWVWREKDGVTQEAGKSSSCCWSWFHGDEDVPGLRDTFCRCTKQNQRFSRVTVWWLTGVSLRQSAVQRTGAGRWSIVRSPMDLSTLHLCDEGGGVFPRMYIRWDLSYCSWILQTMILECMFRLWLAHVGNPINFLFGSSRINYLLFTGVHLISVLH